MFLFKSKTEKHLDSIIQRLEMNMSNNYKDNAQEDLKELETAVNAMRLEGKMKSETVSRYTTILEKYKVKLKDYSHKDQKPYWH
ncbi:MAG: hypothetical protein K6G60_07445 [Lachnospiraceae bacterium]|nr:hypothetical protein [Lachnospiraceae bacterium]